MYKFTKPNNVHYCLSDSSKNDFIELLKTTWDNIHDNTTVFRYKINKVQEKIICGNGQNYLLQLNPDRGTKRRKPEAIESISTPFDNQKFNFNKVSKEEMLFDIVKEGKESDINVLLANVSPITRYHTLFCPSLSKCHPQTVTRDSLEMALDLMFIAQDRDLRIGFNSLCALASVNHLHYHLFLEPNDLPVEKVKCHKIAGPLYCLENYPIPAFCFQIEHQNLVKDCTNDIYKLLSYLLKNSIAHNIFLTRGENVNDMGGKEVKRILIWPRKSTEGVKNFGAFNVAICELSGWFPIFERSDYDSLRAEDLEEQLKKWKLDDFETLCEEVKVLYH